MNNQSSIQTQEAPSEKETPGEFVSVYSFAKLKNVSNTIIYRLIKSGDIHVFIIGARKYIKYADYEHLEFKKKEVPGDKT